MAVNQEAVDDKRQYSRYYEHDGMLRAYANRSMVMAMVFGVLAIGSFAFAVYVRLMPPTVVRVDEAGNATVVGGTPAAGRSHGLTFLASAAESAPSDVEARAVVRRFLTPAKRPDRWGLAAVLAVAERTRGAYFNPGRTP